MPQLLPEILRTLFEIVLFEECSNQWSLSRPMLSLILVNESIFNDLKVQIAAGQPPERRQRLAGCFDRIMQARGRTTHPAAPPTAPTRVTNERLVRAASSAASPAQLAQVSGIHMLRAMCDGDWVGGCPQDVTRSLEPKNRDKFTQNLTVFRHELHAR